MSGPDLVSAGISTRDLRLQVCGETQISLQLELLPQEDPLLKTEAARACPVEMLLPDRLLAASDFQLVSLRQGSEYVTMICAAGPVELRFHWTAAPHEALRLLIQARAINGVELIDGELRLAILELLHPGDLAQPPYEDRGSGPTAADGRSLVRSPHYPLPFTRWSASGGIAVLARYDQRRWRLPRWEPVPAALQVRLRAEWADACELFFVACDPGWQGAFAALRGQIRAEIDLTEYHRPDLAWYKNQWLQHFSFLYGSEIFDHDRGCLDIDRLLDDGQRFGSYDGVLLWPAYPRIGVDQRSQWDFYDDLPGGRAGLRSLAARARERGTRVFIPYLPWDAPPAARHGDPPRAAEQLARVVEDIGADGVFLDTMESILPQFRHAIDRARPGVVFCAEGQPSFEALNQITGSWDQAEHHYTGEIDLLRFLLPEHPSFLINRQAVGAHRERVIDRSLFNGTGLVVWQDIFGEVLPFTAAQAAKVKQTVAILRQHADLFRGEDALPLIATEHPDLLANAFIGKGGRAAITVYNGSNAVITGDLVAWAHTIEHRWRRVDQSQEKDVTGDVLSGSLQPGALAVFVSATPAPR